MWWGDNFFTLPWMLFGSSKISVEVINTVNERKG